MGAPKGSELPPGRLPWDSANGLRIGALTGAVLGAALMAVTGIRSFWLVALTCLAGGVIGFWSQKRETGGSARTVGTLGSVTTSALLRWGLVVAFVGIGFSSLATPRSLSVDAPDSSFSAERAIEHVEAIAREPHPMGSTANAEVREYLVAQLRSKGLEPSLQTVSAPSYYGAAGTVEVVNVYATIAGTASTGTIILVAHYDTEPSTAGANDNAAAVATLLEAGRVLLSSAPLGNDVLLLFTDGEEPWPRYGSPAFIDEGRVTDPAIVVNFEAAGTSGPSLLVEISGAESAMVADFAAAVDDPVAFSFIGETLALLGEIGTDFDPFRAAGVPGYHFAYMRGSPVYHTLDDDLDSVSLDSLQHHGSNAVGLARRFGDRDLTVPVGGDGSVYFTLRPFFVQYRSWVSTAAAGMAALLLGLSLYRTAPGSKPSAVVMARDAARAVLTTVAVTLATTLVWLAIISIRSSPSVTESYVYLLCLVGAGAAATAWLGRFRSRIRVERFAGFSIVWVVLGVLTAVSAPGFSYLFVWPALAAAVAANWAVQEPDGAAVARFALVAGPAIVLIVPAVEFYFQFGQPRPGNPDSSFPTVAAVAFLFTTLAAGLIHETRSLPRHASCGGDARAGHAAFLPRVSFGDGAGR